MGPNEEDYPLAETIRNTTGKIQVAVPGEWVGPFLHDSWVSIQAKLMYLMRSGDAYTVQELESFIPAEATDVSIRTTLERMCMANQARKTIGRPATYFLITEVHRLTTTEAVNLYLHKKERISLVKLREYLYHMPCSFSSKTQLSKVLKAAGWRSESRGIWSPINQES